MQLPNTAPTASLPERGTRFLWQAAGCPRPVETDGTPIPPRVWPGLAPPCASCGAPATHRLDDAISDNFTTVKNASRAWPFGGRGCCTACLWCCKTLGLRCGLFFARCADEHGPGGVWFAALRPIPGLPATKPDTLSVLLAPPPPPFVAGLPLYGIDHGGEHNAHRTIWPWTDDHTDSHQDNLGGSTHPQVTGGLYVPPDPLIRIQSKHTALYVRVSYRQDRYHLQVDDAGDVLVDVPLWSRLRALAEELLIAMRRQGVGAQDAREALLRLRLPRHYRTSAAAWCAATGPMRPHHEATWWGLFVGLLRMPELTKTSFGVRSSVRE